jgi:hypothetical protein
MTNLEPTQARWFELYDELRCDTKFKGRIAPPFLSVPGQNARSILYVGKATAKDGCWIKAPRGSTGARINQGRKYTRKFLAEEAPDYNSGFWQFARELDAEAAKKWKLPSSKTLQHITWTNICKIGTLEGNPSGPLLKKQRDLAIETLLKEIKSYRPQLICFVTWDYAWHLVQEIFGDYTDESWDQTGNEEWVWCRPAGDGLPPALLTGHPERKRAELRKKWLVRASALLAD